ncbi:MAG TPA: hypothetical protein VHA73_15570 [Acidimicrobiales bacterium]|nr:hypothetical protein [Acidimicrobiales bacterium]
MKTDPIVRPGRMWSWLAAALATCLLALTTMAGSPPAGAQQAPGPGAPSPYHDPSFTCHVYDYGTRPPTIPGPADDPLCVRYDKRNIDLGTPGFVDFLQAEPGRVAIVAGKCGYWQQDRWEVRIPLFRTPLVEWSGSYWYDGRTLQAGAAARAMKVAGQPVGGQAFLSAIASLFGSAAASRLAPYVDAGGGGGISYDIPFGSQAALLLRAACGAGHR